MVKRAQVGDVTFEEFVEAVPDGQKADLIHGVIYMASPESFDHNAFELWLATLLHMFVEERGLGTVTVSRVAYKLSQHEAPEPDIAVVLTDRLDIIQRAHVAGPPDIAIEIVSPDSVRRDYEEKRLQYEAAGVKEYWIFDRSTQDATFLAHDGIRFVEIPLEGHIFRSRVLPGFWLDVRWLWQNPLPRTRAILDQLLRTS